MKNSKNRWPWRESPTKRSSRPASLLQSFASSTGSSGQRRKSKAKAFRCSRALEFIQHPRPTSRELVYVQLGRVTGSGLALQWPGPCAVRHELAIAFREYTTSVTRRVRPDYTLQLANPSTGPCTLSISNGFTEISVGGATVRNEAAFALLCRNQNHADAYTDTRCTL